MPLPRPPGSGRRLPGEPPRRLARPTGWPPQRPAGPQSPPCRMRAPEQRAVGRLLLCARGGGQARWVVRGCALVRCPGGGGAARTWSSAPAAPAPPVQEAERASSSDATSSHLSITACGEGGGRCWGTGRVGSRGIEGHASTTRRSARECSPAHLAGRRVELIALAIVHNCTMGHML